MPRSISHQCRFTDGRYDHRWRLAADRSVRTHLSIRRLPRMNGPQSVYAAPEDTQLPVLPVQHGIRNSPAKIVGPSPLATARDSIALTSHSHCKISYPDSKPLTP